MDDDLLGEMSDEEVQEAPPAPDADAAKTIAYWQKRTERAEKQAIERKLAFRRLEVANKHGKSVEDIPDYIPADKLDEFGARFFAQSASTEPEPPAAEVAEPPVEQEVPQGLQAISGPTTTGADAPVVEQSFQELGQMMSTDPERAQRLLTQKLREPTSR